MTGHETAPNGMLMKNYVQGWDLNNGRGFESYKDAKSTWDMSKPPYFSLWKINGEIFQVVKILGKPVFDFYQQEVVLSGT